MPNICTVLQFPGYHREVCLYRNYIKLIDIVQRKFVYNLLLDYSHRDLLINLKDSSYVALVTDSAKLREL